MIGFSRFGEAPTCLALARTTGIASPHPAGSLGSSDVPAIRSRRGELAETVPHHVLGDKHRDMPAAIVHPKVEAYHFGHDHRIPGPRADHGGFTGFPHLVNFF